MTRRLDEILDDVHAGRACADAPLTHTERLPDAAPVALGFAGAAVDGAHLLAPEFLETFTQRHGTTRPYFTSPQWPGTVYVDSGRVIGRRGSVNENEFGVFFDGRTEAATAGLQLDDEQFVVRVTSSGIEFRELPLLGDDGTSPIDELVEWTPPSSTAAVPLRSPEELLAGHDVEPWLVADANQLWARGALHRVAAIGMIIRLWAPATAEARTRALLSGDLGPATLAAEEARSLPEDTLRACVDRAHEVLIRLGEQLERLHNAVVDDNLAVASDLAHALLRERDDLECAWSVLVRTKEGRKLGPALHEFDQYAQTQASLFLSLPPTEDQRLSAAAESDHEAWWLQWVAE